MPTTIETMPEPLLVNVLRTRPQDGDRRDVADSDELLERQHYRGIHARRCREDDEDLDAR
ncbi:MAG: hypothetical protein ACKOEM_17925 [Planctomycetia bacterium]